MKIKPAQLFNKNRTVTLHTVVWLIVFSLPYLLHYNYDAKLRHDPHSVAFFRLGLFTGFFWVISFYLNAFLLTPKLVYGKKYFLYGLILLTIFSVILVIHSFIFKVLLPDLPFNYQTAILFNLPAYLLTIAISVAYRVLADRSRSEHLAQEKTAETLKTELSFLRSQISPHFVFNILNNITAMARLKSEELEPTVIKLSSLLRYMLYEANEEKVSLRAELAYLKSYIELQKQRFGNKVLIKTELESNITDERIEPMLLIPFVENAFKHGIGMITSPTIIISLQMDVHRMVFNVRNKYNSGSTEIKDKTSGIGLANVKRRLDLLYEKDYELVINNDKGWYDVTLMVNLH